MRGAAVPLVMALAAALQGCGAADSSAARHRASAWVNTDTLKVLQIRDTAPDFNLEVIAGPNETGARMHLASFRGRVVVLNSWAVSCGPCVEEFPTLNELARRYAPSGVQFLGVLPDDGEAALRQFARQHGAFVFPQLGDPTWSTFPAFGRSAFPSFAIINSAGQVAWRHTGGPMQDVVLSCAIDRVSAGEFPDFGVCERLGAASARARAARKSPS